MKISGSNNEFNSAKPFGARYFWRIFFVFFIAAAVFLNWNKLSLFLNYRVIEHSVSSVLQIENIEMSGEERGEALFNNVRNNEEDGNNILIIPKIGVYTKIIEAKSGSIKDGKEALKRGVLLYYYSSPPGSQAGKTIILGHSAGKNWPIKNDSIFNGLKDLKAGDLIKIRYKGNNYRYRVYAKRIFFPKNEKQALKTNGKSGVLILITCWPLGKNYQRLAVFALLEK